MFKCFKEVIRWAPLSRVFLISYMSGKDCSYSPGSGWFWPDQKKILRNQAPTSRLVWTFADKCIEMYWHMDYKQPFLSPILRSSVNVCPRELCRGWTPRNLLTVQSCSVETHLYAESGPAQLISTWLKGSLRMRLQLLGSAGCDSKKWRAWNGSHPGFGGNGLKDSMATGDFWGWDVHGLRCNMFLFLFLQFL